jgi:transcriptional regulator with XRE-family HTH domain
MPKKQTMTLREWRESKGWSTREAGRHFGWSHVYQQQLESGRNSPTMRKADEVEAKTGGMVTRLDWPKHEIGK